MKTICAPEYLNPPFLFERETSKFSIEPTAILENFKANGTLLKPSPAVEKKILSTSFLRQTYEQKTTRVLYYRAEREKGKNVARFAATPNYFRPNETEKGSKGECHRIVRYL